MNIIEKFNLKKIDLTLGSVLFIAFILRFINLGYSDFQGDEIKALFLPDDPKNIGAFLLSQRKGPLQFLITFLLKFLDPQYTNQFLIRLPFTIAAFLAVYYFYKLVKLYLGTKTAAYSTLFMATNGFFVAFARIAQYQSLVILFCILSLYTLSLAVTKSQMRVKGLFLAMLFWALAFLAHYDALFTLPAMLMLGVKWFKLKDIKKPDKLKYAVIGGLIFAVLTLAFYIPFLMYVSQNTRDYWTSRLTGEASPRLSSSYYLFTVYQPIYSIHFYMILFTFSIIALLFVFLHKHIRWFISKIRIIKLLKPFWLASDDIIINKATLPVFFTMLFWFALPFLFWEKVVHIPGTHIYTYLIPVFILMGIGMEYLENAWTRLTAKMRVLKPELIKNVLVGGLFIFLGLQSYTIFVDNSKEYPWQSKSFFIWTLPVPSHAFNLSLFGFPYFRDWESIGRFVSSDKNVTAYTSNERESITRYYVKLDKNTDNAGYFIYIRHPQTFTEAIVSPKALYWANNHQPIYTYSKGGTDLVDIYLMPVGSVQEIQSKGL